MPPHHLRAYRRRVQTNAPNRAIDGLRLAHERGGTTVLRGQVVDPAALHGWLPGVRDLGRLATRQPRETALVVLEPRGAAGRTEPS